MNITELKRGSLNGLRRQINECLDNAYNKGYEDGAKNQDEVQYKNGYDKGLEDAKLTLLNLYKIPSGEWVNIFDTDSYYVEAILRHYSINEIVKRIKAYEEKKKAEEEIKVGDEVYLLDINATMIVTANDGDNVVCLARSGKYSCYCGNQISQLKKTGKNVADKLKALFSEVEE